jgi:hypothetical protein
MTRFPRTAAECYELAAHVTLNTLTRVLKVHRAAATSRSAFHRLMSRAKTEDARVLAQDVGGAAVARSPHQDGPKRATSEKSLEGLVSSLTRGLSGPMSGAARAAMLRASSVAGELISGDPAAVKQAARPAHSPYPRPLRRQSFSERTLLQKQREQRRDAARSPLTSSARGSAPNSVGSASSLGGLPRSGGGAASSGGGGGPSEMEHLGRQSADLNVVMSIVLPVLHEAVAAVEEAISRGASRWQLYGAVPPFCRTLLDAAAATEHRTLLALAAGVGCVQLVEALLTLHQLGVHEVARMSINGETALHEAALSGSLKVCTLLLEHTDLQLTGAYAENADGKTPLELCAEPLHSQLADYAQRQTFAAFLSHYKVRQAHGSHTLNHALPLRPSAHCTRARADALCACVSVPQVEAASVAHVLKRELTHALTARAEAVAYEQALTTTPPNRRRPSTDVFYDSDNLRNLSDLLKHVAASDVLVVLLTPHVLTRPWYRPRATRTR